MSTPTVPTVPTDTPRIIQYDVPEGLTFKNGVPIVAAIENTADRHFQTADEVQYIARAIQVGHSLSLFFHSETDIDDCYDMLLQMASSSAPGLISVGGRYVPGWSITKQQLFNSRYETRFDPPLSPDIELKVCIVPPSSPGWVAPDYGTIVRSRRTGIYYFIANPEWDEAEKNEAIELAREDLKAYFDAPLQWEYERSVAAWKLMGMFAVEVTSDTPDEDWLESFRSEMGEERYTRMIAAAKIVAPLVPLFLR